MGAISIVTSSAKALSLSSGIESLCCSQVILPWNGTVMKMPTWSASGYRTSDTSPMVNEMLEKIRSYIAVRVRWHPGFTNIHEPVYGRPSGDIVSLVPCLCHPRLPERVPKIGEEAAQSLVRAQICRRCLSLGECHVEKYSAAQRVRANNGFANLCFYAIFPTMSTVKEIEAAIPRLTRAEIEQLREWIEDYLEDQLELTDEVKSKLEQSRGEIAAGQFTTPRPQ